MAGAVAGIVREPRPRPKGNAQNPTIRSLMATPVKDRKGWRDVRVPRLTKVAHVRFDPIWLGSFKCEPGEIYNLPPELADELEAAINRFEQVPMQQMTGKSEVQRGVLEELAAQDDFARKQRVASLVGKES